MSESYSNTNLIINNIPSVISDDQLTKLFYKFGSIKSCKIIRNNDKDSKTFGFCEYSDPKSAKTALHNLDNFKLHDRILKVSYAKLFPKPKGKSIEVSNLPKTTQEEIVKKYFSSFGKIVRMRLISNASDGTKTAEIIYENKLDAEKASHVNCVKWTGDNGKQVMINVYMVSQERDSGNVNNGKTDKIMIGNNNNNAVNSLSLQKQLGDNYFYLKQQQQTQASTNNSQQAFNNHNAYDLSNFQGIFNSYSLNQIYQNQIPLTNAVSNGYYSPPSYNYFGLTLPQYSSYDIADKAGLHSLGIYNGTAAASLAPPPHVIYPNYNSFINSANSTMSLGIPFIYNSTPNTFPLKPSTNSDGTMNPYEQQQRPFKQTASFKSSDYFYKNYHPPCKNACVVYVYNIGNSTNKDQLRDLFAAKYGKDIVRVDVPKDLQNGSYKNFGFVTFNNFTAAQLAIQEMNGKDFQGKPLQVSFKK